ncbi:MAG: hypothetical protein RIS34_350 [Pseudomonadota bacterium]
MVTHARKPLLPKSLRHWLAVKGSLSQHLAALGSHYRVRPLQQKSLRLLPTENTRLLSGQGTRHWGREVLLSVDGQALVFARSLTLAHAVQGPWRALRSLGTRPLADLLYARRPARRYALPVRRLRPVSPLHTHVLRALQRHHRAVEAAKDVDAGECAAPRPQGQHARVGGLWMRSARFTRPCGGPALLVQEVFLPSIHPLSCPDLDLHGRSTFQVPDSR